MIHTRTAEILAEADALLAALGERETRPLPPVRVSRGQGQLRARVNAAHRLPPLPCGCHDPACYQHRYGECRAA